MSGVGPTLARARSEGRAALVGYLPVGYPDVDTSIAAMVAMVEGGVDIVEVGRALLRPVDGRSGHPARRRGRAGRGHPDPRRLPRRRRRSSAAGAPALVMTYWNPVEQYGVSRFAADLAAAGGAGLITPDLIPDEAGAWLAAAEENDLDRVFLVAPSSTPERLAATTRACRGLRLRRIDHGRHRRAVRGRRSRPGPGRAGSRGHRSAASASASACRPATRRPRSPPSPTASSSARPWSAA